MIKLSINPGIISKLFDRKNFALIPGLAFAAIIAAIAAFLGSLNNIVNDVIIAILSAAVIRNFIGITELFRPGLVFIIKKVLRLAIILLGMQLSFQQIVVTGKNSFLVILFVVIVAIPLTYILGKNLGLNSEISTLLGVGSAICGATAVIATAPAIKAKERDVALAVATVFIFNTLALFLFPVLGKLLDLSYITYGTWTGVAVQDVSSVVATGFALSQDAGEVATVVKLTRTVFIVPVIFLVSLLFTWKRQKTGDTDGNQVNYVKVFPWFVVGFLFMALLNSFGVFSNNVAAAMKPITHYLIVMVMAGVGADLDFKEMQTVGFSFLYTGLAGMLIMSVLSFILIKLMGIGY
ncbi:MAG: putative sulfate exporter family transporter [Thermincola sp.]|jgi:uncharacterized integral membrane protein (TIGR00698 family)|nr:putative sulfate exporter family transporter [Thermincola sp.]MDT3703626.1 putative sulfate exporter family transporter [Thermincola sp.]